MVATSYRQWTQVNVRQTYGICAITRVIANERAFKIRFLNMFKNLPAISWAQRSGSLMASERTCTMRSPCDNHAIITTILLGMGGNPRRNYIHMGDTILLRPGVSPQLNRIPAWISAHAPCYLIYIISFSLGIFGPKPYPLLGILLQKKSPVAAAHPHTSVSYLIYP